MKRPKLFPSLFALVPLVTLLFASAGFADVNDGVKLVVERKVRNYRSTLATFDPTRLNVELNKRTRALVLMCTGHAVKTIVVAAADTMPALLEVTIPFKVLEYMILGLDDLSDEADRREAGAPPLHECESAAVHSLADPRAAYAFFGTLGGGLSPILDLPVMLSERKIFIVGQPGLFPVTQAAYDGTAVTMKRGITACELQERYLTEIFAEAHARNIELRSLGSPDDFHQRIVFKP